jgi:RNA polymerase sigma-70 factor (ECF subfamily)
MVGLPQPEITLDDTAPEITGAEALLVARAQRDPAAFAPLYEAYFDAVYRYCYHRLGDWSAAEDAASLVFTNALAALPRFRTYGRSGSFRSWLFAIAHNVVVNHHRAQGRRQAIALVEAHTVPDRSPSPEEEAVAAETSRSVHALLSQLTHDQRQVVELRLAGLTDAEIASVLGRRHGAIRAAQYRALLKLRALFAAGGEEARHA